MVTYKISIGGFAQGASSLANKVIETAAKNAESKSNKSYSIVINPRDCGLLVIQRKMKSMGDDTEISDKDLEKTPSEKACRFALGVLVSGSTEKIDSLSLFELFEALALIEPYEGDNQRVAGRTVFNYILASISKRLISSSKRFDDESMSLYTLVLFGRNWVERKSASRDMLQHVENMFYNATIEKEFVTQSLVEAAQRFGLVRYMSKKFANALSLEYMSDSILCYVRTYGVVSEDLKNELLAVMSHTIVSLEYNESVAALSQMVARHVEKMVPYYMNARRNDTDEDNVKLLVALQLLGVDNQAIIYEKDEFSKRESFFNARESTVRFSREKITFGTTSVDDPGNTAASISLLASCASTPNWLRATLKLPQGKAITNAVRDFGSSWRKEVTSQTTENNLVVFTTSYEFRFGEPSQTKLETELLADEIEAFDDLLEYASIVRYLITDEVNNIQFDQTVPDHVKQNIKQLLSGWLLRETTDETTSDFTRKLESIQSNSEVFNTVCKAVIKSFKKRLVRLYSASGDLGFKLNSIGIQWRAFVDGKSVQGVIDEEERKRVFVVPYIVTGSKKDEKVFKAAKEVDNNTDILDQNDGVDPQFVLSIRANNEDEEGGNKQQVFNDRFDRRNRGDRWDRYGRWRRPPPPPPRWYYRRPGLLSRLLF